MGLRDKYSYAIQTAKALHMQGSADEREGKLYFHGTVGTQDEANQIWNASDPLSRISKETLGDANAYMEIFNANRDQLSDPNKIKPGQVLKIPAGAKSH